MTAGDWRAAAADAIDAQAAVFEVALADLDTVDAVLEQLGRDRASHEVRAVAATLRSEIGDLRAQARTLRAPAAGDGFPIALTTRHVRKELQP